MIHVGDMREVLATLGENTIDAIVTDPPYELGFMGKGWDKAGVSFDPATWAAALRVAKPGAHLLAFGGSRTFHRIAVAIEDGGWQVRDTLCWLYGTGFPKSLNGPWGGTALKPAWEPIIMARKPLEGTVAGNVQKWGAGGVNIDACRVGIGKDKTPSPLRRFDSSPAFTGLKHLGGNDSVGRWPANVCLDEEAAGMVDEQSGESKSGPPRERNLSRARVMAFGMTGGSGGFGDSGGASRFFFISKGNKCDPNVQIANAVGIRCGSCGIVTALDHVKASVSRDQFALGLDSTNNSENFTQTHRPVDVENRENTGTIPITPIFCGSCGCVLRVTGEPTNLENAGRGAGDSVPVDQMRFLYSAKASRREREAGLDNLPERAGHEAVDRKPGTAGLNSPRAGAGRTAGGLDSLEEVCYADPPWGNAVLSQRLLAGTGLSLGRVIVGSTIRDNNGSAWSMCWCGSLCTDPFHPDTKSTIETAINSTMPRPTLNSSRQQHTNGCMAVVFGVLVGGGNLAGCVANESPWAQRTGISQSKGGLSMDDADPATSVESWLISKPERGGGHRVGVRNFHPT